MLTSKKSDSLVRYVESAFFSCRCASASVRSVSQGSSLFLELAKQSASTVHHKNTRLTSYKADKTQRENSRVQGSHVLSFGAASNKKAFGLLTPRKVTGRVEVGNPCKDGKVVKRHLNQRNESHMLLGLLTLSAGSRSGYRRPGALGAPGSWPPRRSAPRRAVWPTPGTVPLPPAPVPPRSR